MFLFDRSLECLDLKQGFPLGIQEFGDGLLRLNLHLMLAFHLELSQKLVLRRVKEQVVRSASRQISVRDLLLL